MTDTVEGVVKHANDGGVKLEGEESYRNFTKPEWRKEPWDEPNKGDLVKLALNNGFVYAIKRVSSGNGASPTPTTDRETVFNRKWALECSLSHYNAKGGAMSLEEVVLGAEFLLTFLEASEPPSENPFDGDPGPENPFE